MKAGTCLNFISHLCQGSLRIKQVTAFSHPLKAFLCMGEQGRNLPVWIHKAGQRKAQKIGKEKPREVSSSCFCSLMAAKQEILFLRAQGRLGIFSSEPNSTSSTRKVFPNTSQLSSRADPGLFFSHWGCGKAACLVRHNVADWLSLLQALWSCWHPCISDFGLNSSNTQIVNDSNALHLQLLNLSLLLSRKGEETDLFTLLGCQRTETNCKKEQHTPTLFKSWGLLHAISPSRITALSWVVS